MHSAQSSFVLSEIRAGRLGGFKRVLRELYKLIYELINYMNVPLKVLTVFRNDSMAFCFHLRFVIPKGSVLNRNTALSTEFIKRHLLTVSGFTETFIYLQPVCTFCLAKNGPHLHAQL